MKPIKGHIQVFSIWVNGRDINDTDQHFPIDCNVNTHEWRFGLKQVVNDFYKVKVKDADGEHGFYSEIFKDFHVALCSIDINIKDFENRFDLDFDIEDENVQEMIPYYVDYDLNVVAERIGKFSK